MILSYIDWQLLSMLLQKLSRRGRQGKLGGRTMRKGGAGRSGKKPLRSFSQPIATPAKVIQSSFMQAVVSLSTSPQLPRPSEASPKRSDHAGTEVADMRRGLRRDAHGNAQRIETSWTHALA